MTAVAQTEAVAPTLEDLSLEEALDNLAVIDGFIKSKQPELDAARAAAQDLRTIIKLRMEERKATRFERGGWRSRFTMVKQGAASLNMPTELRAFLISTGEIPLKEIDDALPIVIAPPIVKGDLRKVRKLADYGGDCKKAVEAHIFEPRQVEQLIIEPVEIDVTPKTEAA
jgi:hypothetical protein